MDKAGFKEALKQAMKARDQVRMDTIRGILSALQYEEMQKEVENLPDEAILALLKNELKKRKEEVEYAEKAQRTEDLAKLAAEIKTIEEFLPSQLTAADLEKVLLTLKAEQPGLNMGLAMKVLKEKYAGQYDGKMASELAKKLLG